jgi:hypothetical protein
LIGHEFDRGTAENYRRFAALEASGRSPLYVPAPDPGPAPALLARDGRTALAFVDGHGAWIRWFT